MPQPTNAIQAIKAAGSVVSAQELKNIQSKFGTSALNNAVSFVQKSPNYGLGDSGKTFYQSTKTASASPLPPASSNTQGIYTAGVSAGKYGIEPGYYSEQEYGFLSASALTQLNGDIEKEIAQIQGLTASNVANIQGGYNVQTANISAEASKYMSDRDLEARKYLADQDFAKAVKVTEIQGKNNLDLQAIVNAGLKEVEGIRGQTAKDVANITGEFGVKQEETRQSGQKDIARIGEQAGYRNALISAFSF